MRVLEVIMGWALVKKNGPFRDKAAGRGEKSAPKSGIRVGPSREKQGGQ